MPEQACSDRPIGALIGPRACITVCMSGRGGSIQLLPPGLTIGLAVNHQSGEISVLWWRLKEPVTDVPVGYRRGAAMGRAFHPWLSTDVNNSHQTILQETDV